MRIYRGSSQPAYYDVKVMVTITLDEKVMNLIDMNTIGQLHTMTVIYIYTFNTHITNREIDREKRQREFIAKQTTRFLIGRN